MHVAIVIVGFRNPEDLVRCLDGVGSSNYADFEVVICENGGAEAFAVLSMALPSRLAGGQTVRVMAAEGNVGFAGGVNLCMSLTPDADAWWVLNPDTCPQDDTLSGLVQRLQSGACDAVGCALRLPDGTIQSYGGRWHPWLARPVSIGKGSSVAQTANRDLIERTQNYLNGASMLIGRAFLRKAGPMREDYFLYCEEVEWCLRALSRGAKLGFSASSPMLHYQGTTTGVTRMSRTSIYLGMRNKILLTRDLYPLRLPVAALFALLLLLWRYVRKGAWRQIGYGVAGFSAGLLNQRGAPVWLKDEVNADRRAFGLAPGAERKASTPPGRGHLNPGMSSISAAPMVVEQPTFRHVILTRFNVRWEDNPNTPSIGVDPAWLSERFDLFERYCLPSVLAQTERNFDWLLFFNEKTPAAYVDRIRALNLEHPFIVPVFCDSLPLTEVQQAVRNVVGGKADWLLTSRLDNDDGIHPQFVAMLQKAQRFQEAEVLNYPYGVIFRAGRTYRRRDLSNAFISLSEPASASQTVFSIPRHVYARDSYPVRQMPVDPMWLQVIHESNVSNRVRGIRIPVSSIAAPFPSLKDLSAPESEIRTSVILENMTLYPLRSLSDWLIMLVRRSAKLFGIDLYRKASRPRSGQASP